MLASELIALIESRTGRPGVKRGHNTRLLCPAHDDHNPSLDIAAAADGSALVVCRSQGCTYEAILEALGVEPGGDNGNWTPSGTAIAHYPYRDEGGLLLYEVVRTDSKQFPQRRPDPTARSGWRWRLGDVRRVLYRLPELIAAVKAGEQVYLVEGEKDAERLRRQGVVATCNPGGAGKWRDEYAQALRGASVRVVADRDEPGYEHARRVARSLQHVGASVELLQPAVPTEHADLSDHLDAGRALEELLPLALAEPGAEDAFRFQVRSAAEMMALPEPDEGYELLGPLVCRGARTIVVGDTGHGKTSLAFQMLRSILLGLEMLGHEGAGVGPVLVVDLEQGIRSIKRSLREAGLDERSDVLYVTVPDGLALDQSPEEYAALEAVLAERHPAVVLLDPYYKAHRAEDPNAERPIIDLMRSLDALRSAYGFALLLPAHPRKADALQRGSRKLTIHDVAGSGAATRGAEIVLGIERLGQGSARLRYLKDRDGDLPVGEATPLLYSKEGGFVLNEESTETDEGATAALLAGPENVWMTTREWAKEVKVTHVRVKALLEQLADDPSQPFWFAQPAPDRHPSARCYARCSEKPEHLRTPDQLALGVAGVPGVPPYGGRRGEHQNTSTPVPEHLAENTSESNPLLDPEEEA